MSTDNATVLVIDDDPSIRESLRNLIRSTGLSVQTWASAQEFLSRPRPDAPSCLVLDVELPGLSGLDLQQELVRGDVQIPIIFITGHGDIPMTVRAMKAVAVEFLTKPCRDEDLLNAIEQAISHSRRLKQLRTEPADEKRDPGVEIDREIGFSEIVGNSEALRGVLRAVETVAPTDSTVLICGETGTGKELIARAIHNVGGRRSKPFVKLNCAAIPSGLLESELFGHEKGAFTGAIVHRVGPFELANRGTLFLDEIGDLPLELQPKLLRVLQEIEFERLGGTRTMRLDVRLVAATNVALAQMVAERRFRDDLYYRLNVFPIVMPPLRGRREDIPALVRHFVQKYALRMKRRIETISPMAMRTMMDHHWPGNVRELANVVERAVILCSDPVLQPEHLGSLAPTGVARPPSLTLYEVGSRAPTSAARGAEGVPVGKAGASGAMPLAEMERQAVADALRRANGNKSRAAALLGVTRTQLYTRLKRFGFGREQPIEFLRPAASADFRANCVDPHTRGVSVHAGP